jgi:hypothetical protein
MTLICFRGGPQDGVTGDFELPEQAEPGLRLQCFTAEAGADAADLWYELTSRQVATEDGLAEVATFLGRELPSSEAGSRGLAVVPSED